MFILDTVVLSELRKKERNHGLTEWISLQRGENLFLSVVSIGEIERGIYSVAKKDKDFANRLSAWRDKLLTVYADHLIPVSVSIAQKWGKLSVEAGNSGADILIAATALEHKMTVVTRNTRHFSITGVSVCNPWT